MPGKTSASRSGNIAWCRLRESNTRHPRYEGGALPSELSRRKWTNGQRRRFRNRKRPCNRDSRSEQSARRWPILDVHDVKQQSFHVRRNDAFRRRESYARNLHADRVTRAASPSIAATPTRARPNADDARGVKAKTFVLESFVGPFGPSCLFGGGVWPAAG